MKWISRLFSKLPNISGIFSKALLGAFILLFAVSLFQNWQIKQLNSALSDERTNKALLIEENKVLTEDIISLQGDIVRKEEAYLFWRKQSTALEKRTLKLEEKYDEAIKKAPKETQECLSTPLPDDVFHSLTGM